MRYVIIIFVSAVLIGYDLLKLNGHYLRIISHEVSSLWSSAEHFVFSFF